MNEALFNEGFSDQQVCRIIKLYVKDNIDGKQLSIQLGVEQNRIYSLLHNYGFNFGHTRGKSDVRGTFGPIFARYHYSERDIDNCIARYIRDYRSRYSPCEVKYYLQNMLSELGEQLEMNKTSHTPRSAAPSAGSAVDSGIMDKLGQVVSLIIGLVVIVLLLRGCAFVGDKISGLPDFFSNKYEFESFQYEGTMYAGNKKANKPNGICAGIPARSNGTTYSLGNYKGSEIDGLGIIGSSNIPLQAGASENKDASDYDEARLQIKMGEMEENLLNGYGVVYDSSGEVVIGKYKDGKLKKWGCKVVLDGNGNILSVNALKGDKVKKQLGDGTYKGMTYYPEKGVIEMDDYEFAISAGQISMSTKGVNISVNGREWIYDYAKEGIYIDYDLGEHVKCEVTTNVSDGVRVHTSEMPISYGGQ